MLRGEGELPQPSREHLQRWDEVLLTSQAKTTQHGDSTLTLEVQWAHGHA